MRRLTALGLAAWLAWPAHAATFDLPADGGDVVGQVRVVVLADARNTLLDVARHFDLSLAEIKSANRGVPVWTPERGARIVVPTEFILPPGPRAGIVIDIPRRRLYFYPPGQAGRRARVVTFPVGIARPGWPTPLGLTRIVSKERNPAWTVPPDIALEHARQGAVDFPRYVPPGPDNPMGMHALRTGFAEIFIHGTDRPWGVGMRVSHGCIHLYPEDAALLFRLVRIGTPVRIIDRPVLLGVRAGRVYLSSSPTVADYPSRLPGASRAVAAWARLRHDHPGEVPAAPPWRRLLAAAAARGIVPVLIAPAGAAPRSAAPLPYTDRPYGADANGAAPPAPESAAGMSNTRTPSTSGSRCVQRGSASVRVMSATPAPQCSSIERRENS